MTSRRTRTLTLTLLVILCTGVVGFVFWNSETYRAATPLVFILGAIILLVPALNGLLSQFILPRKDAGREAQAAARERVFREEDIWRRNLPQLITNLYFAHIQHYPEWIRESRDYVPSSVTNAGKTDEGSVRLLLYFADYIFPFRELALPSAGVTNLKQGVLEIIREGARVMTLRVSQTADSRGNKRWQPVAIETFHLGPWIRDFENLRAEIVAIIKDREREAREN